MKKVLLTGGGTAGHVTPNIALLPGLLAAGREVVYVGRQSGVERELLEKRDVKYYGITSGKLRRYVSKENIIDMFKVIKGLGEALVIIMKEKPDVIFSKGGFVAVPVVAAGWLCRVPVIIHESDVTPGLANKLAAPFAKSICVSFPETLAYIKEDKAVVTGTPIRDELLGGNAAKGLKICGFNNWRPVLLVMGGSSGAMSINACVRHALPKLLKKFQVIHICGRGNTDETIKRQGYKQFDYIDEDLPHILRAADVVVTRAGANAIAEFLALGKPCLLVPLPLSASRGDQIVNAETFAARSFGRVLTDEDLNVQNLTNAVDDLYENRETFQASMAGGGFKNGSSAVLEVIEKHLEKKPTF